MPTNLVNAPLNNADGEFHAPALEFVAPSSGSPAVAGTECRYTVLPDSPSITWTDKDRSATETYLMRSEQVPAFAHKAIGLQIPFEGAAFFMRHKRRMPGFPNLVATRISARPFEPGRPADPFLTSALIADPDLEPSFYQSYSRFMQVTIEYSTEVTEPGIEDLTGPITYRDVEQYTEVKTTVAAEFMTLGQQNTYWVPIVGANSGGFTKVLHVPAADRNNWHLDIRNHEYVTLTAAEVAEANRNQSYELANATAIPTVERTIIWRHVWEINYDAILNNLGRVNSETAKADNPGNWQPRFLAPSSKPWQMPFLNDAPPETVLFIGATITREPMAAPDGAPLFTIEFRFAEKQIRVFVDPTTGALSPIGTGVFTPEAPAELRILGWNHYWQSASSTTGGTWKRLIINKDTLESPYKFGNFLRMFTRGVDVNARYSAGQAAADFTMARNRDTAERGQDPSAAGNAFKPLNSGL